MNAAIEIHHDAAGQCFEARVDGLRCEPLYQLSAGLMRIHHTRAPPRLEGRVLAAAAAPAAPAHARAPGWRVQPACSHLRGRMRRHPLKEMWLCHFP